MNKNNSFQHVNNRKFGEQGEDIAAQRYLAAGYTLLEKNWSVSEGEIDLIVTTSATVVFVEVKRRSSFFFGSPEAAVDWRKQVQVRKVASIWLANSEDFYEDIRFDVAAVDKNGSVKILEGCF